MKISLKIIMIWLLLVGLCHAKTGDLSIVAMDHASRDTLQRVNISLLNKARGSHEDFEICTHKKGVHLIRQVPVGTYDLTLESYRYASRTIESVQVVSDSTIYLEIDLSRISPLTTRPITDNFGNVGSIQGKVINQFTGDPLPNTNIYLKATRYGVGTDQGGKFLIAEVPTGIYTLVAKYIGFESVRIDSFQVFPDSTRQVDFEMKFRVLE